MARVRSPFVQWTDRTERFIGDETRLAVVSRPEQVPIQGRSMEAALADVSKLENNAWPRAQWPATGRFDRFRILLPERYSSASWTQLSSCVSSTTLSSSTWTCFYRAKLSLWCFILIYSNTKKFVACYVSNCKRGPRMRNICENSIVVLSLTAISIFLRCRDDFCQLK